MDRPLHVNSALVTIFARALVAPTLVLCLALTASAGAAECDGEALGAVIDSAGASLRRINVEGSTGFDKRLRTLQRLKGWSDDELPGKIRPLVQDEEILAADERVNELFGRINALGDESSGGAPDCARLAELKAESALLRKTIEKRWTRMYANLDREIAEARGTVEEPAPAAVKPKLPKTAEGDADQWSATIEADPDYSIASLPAPMPIGELESYSIKEIEGAGRGFFGSISVGLASVIGHAFEKFGRPRGYILGKEGGGAFVAGLRYGEGRINTKNGDTRRLYWQGPSIGYDFGAEGGRTMILVYNLKSVDQIFTQFPGVDGSAYLVGGVGITFMTDGDIILAPIRSGVGLRLGANIGLLKFTSEPTWNPF